MPKEKNEPPKEEKYTFEEVPTDPVSVNWVRPVSKPMNYDAWQPKDVLSSSAQVPTGPVSTQWQNLDTIDNY